MLVEFELTCWWLEDRPVSTLTAIYLTCAGQLHCAVTDEELVADSACSVGEQFSLWCSQHRLLPASPGMLLPLQPTFIPKPWGQEIWFTGVEERGVCRFGDNRGSTPIPWLQAVLPGNDAGSCEQPLVLLKILDPAPSEVTGDLYFELHEQKREVYVVTHIDPAAWPEGVGYIRYGFNPDKLAEAGSDELFRKHYLAAVHGYEAVRRQIDESTETPSRELLQQESHLRMQMDSYTHMQPLAVGDVVVVPLLMPHSLQHGVRTIEFQTPVYERKILSFAQRVLTQGHWDTDAAVQQMALLPPVSKPFECLLSEPGAKIERIVDFPDFEVRRIRVEAGSAFELSTPDSYGLVMLVEGDIQIQGGHFGPEQSFLLPRGRVLALGPPEGAQPLVLLLALPRS